MYVLQDAARSVGTDAPYAVSTAEQQPPQRPPAGRLGRRELVPHAANHPNGDRPSAPDADIAALLAVPVLLTGRLLQAENLLTGTLPASWLGASPFPSLVSMGLLLNKLEGTLPSPAPNCSLCRSKVSAPLHHRHFICK